MTPGRRIFVATVAAGALLCASASAAVWTAPEELAPNGSAPDVAIAKNSDAVAVWTAPDGSAMARIRPASTYTWQPAITISPQGQTVREPSVAMGLTGLATAVWSAGSAPSTEVWTATRTDGSPGWGPATQLDLDPATLSARSPQVFDSAGNVTIVWVRQTAAGQQVVASGAGGFGVMPISTIETSPITSIRTYGGLTLTSGTFLWTRADGSVQSATRPTGIFSFATTTLKPAGAAVAEANIAVAAGTATTRLLASWLEGAPGATRAVFAHRLTTETTWSAATQLDSDPGTDVDVVVTPATGGFNFSWYHILVDGVSYRVRSKRINPDLTMTTALDFAGLPDPIAYAQESGRPVITLSGASAAPEIRAMGTRVVPEGQGGRNARAAVSFNGDAALAWSRPDSPGVTPVMASLYDANAPLSQGVTKPSGAVGELLTFAASANDPFTQPTFHWSFGDGSSAVGASVTHIYSAPGTFLVSIVIRDGGGNVNTTGTGSITIVSAATSPAASPSPVVTPAPSASPPAVPSQAWVRGRSVGIRARVTLAAGKRCRGRVTATIGTGPRLRRASMTLAMRTFAGRRLCLATGILTPAAVPKAESLVTLKATTIRTRTARVKATR